MKKDTSKTNNKYKQMIINRLTHKTLKSEKGKNSTLESLQTQCTPNDKTQDMFERMFQNFSTTYKVGYKSILLKTNPKPIARCLYPQLLLLGKRDNQTTKTRANTQVSVQHSTEKQKTGKNRSIKKTKTHSQANLKKNRSESVLKVENHSSNLRRVHSKKQLKSSKHNTNDTTAVRYIWRDSTKSLNRQQIQSRKPLPSKHP